MKYLFIISLVIIGMASCKSKKAVEGDSDMSKEVSSADNKDSLFASYEKTACFGMCPIFKLTVYKSGLAYYEGMKNVDKIGLYEGRIAADELNKLMNSAEQINYFGMEAVYDGKVTDLPSTIYVINNGERKQVIDRYQGPRELDGLSAQFNEMISNTTWKKVTESERY